MIKLSKFTKPIQEQSCAGEEKKEMRILKALEKKTDKMLKRDAEVHKKLGEEVELEEGIKEKITGAIRHMKRGSLGQSKRDVAMDRAAAAHEEGKTRKANRYLAYAEKSRKAGGVASSFADGKYRTKLKDFKEELDLSEGQVDSSHKALHDHLTSSGYKLSKEHPDHYEYSSSHKVARSPEGTTSGEAALRKHGFKADGTDSREGKKYVHKFKHSDGRSAVAITRTIGDSSHETKIKVSKHTSAMKEGVTFEGFDLEEGTRWTGKHFVYKKPYDPEDSRPKSKEEIDKHRLPMNDGESHDDYHKRLMKHLLKGMRKEEVSLGEGKSEGYQEWPGEKKKKFGAGINKDLKAKLAADTKAWAERRRKERESGKGNS